ncbi:unnamed protein product, partial [Amoebophrya sp. A25]
PEVATILVPSPCGGPPVQQQVTRFVCHGTVPGQRNKRCPCRCFEASWTCNCGHPWSAHESVLSVVSRENRALLGREWVCGGLRVECVEIAEETRSKWASQAAEQVAMGQLTGEEAKQIAASFTERLKLSRVAEARMHEAVDDLETQIEAPPKLMKVVYPKQGIAYRTAPKFEARSSLTAKVGDVVEGRVYTKWLKLQLPGGFGQDADTRGGSCGVDPEGAGGETGENCTSKAFYFLPLYSQDGSKIILEEVPRMPPQLRHEYTAEVEEGVVVDEVRLSRDFASSSSSRPPSSNAPSATATKRRVKTSTRTAAVGGGQLGSSQQLNLSSRSFNRNEQGNAEPHSFSAAGSPPHQLYEGTHCASRSEADPSSNDTSRIPSGVSTVSSLRVVRDGHPRRGEQGAASESSAPAISCAASPSTISPPSCSTSAGPPGGAMPTSSVRGAN